MGQYTAHGYLYKPSYGETGRDTTSQFNAGLDLVDAYMAGEAFSAPDFGTSTLAEIVAAIGSDPATIYFPSSTVNIDENTTVPANIVCIIPDGGILDVATDVTLTINGPIEAGPYQIFSWTGTGAINISGSPTSTIYLEWWGAVTGTSNDCTNAINKCFASRGNHQAVTLLKGYYRITSAVTCSGSAFGTLTIRGQGMANSAFYIDIGGSDTGFTFGTPSTWLYYTLKFENFGFVGPTACCEYGVRFNMLSVFSKNVNFWMGASAYGLAIYGCEHCNMDSTFFYYWNAGTIGPAGAMFMDRDAVSTYANTVWKLDIHAHGNGTPTDKFTNPVLNASYLVGAELTGSIEFYDIPLQISNSSQLTWRDFYVENAGGDGGTFCYFTSVNKTTLQSVIINDDSLETIFNGCQSITITSCQLVDTYFRANCRGIILGSNIMFYNTRIYDEGNAIVSTAEAIDTQIMGEDKSNILYNSSLTRWDSDSPDDFGYVTGVFTKCGVGLGDTTRHNTPYCAKLTTNAALGVFGNTLDANQLQRILGRNVVLNANIYVPTGETLSSIVPEVNLTLPAWADANTYSVGEGYTDGNGYTWTVIQGGTSGGSEPSWPNPPTSSSLMTDNTVIWGYRGSGYAGGNYVATDIGIWHPVGLSKYIPKNATAVTVDWLVYRDTTDCSAYISEPTLLVGQTVNSSFIPGAGENIQAFIQIGANKISYGTAVPASGWCERGDIVWRTDATAAQSPGWICTASGTGGGTAVWKAFANVAA